MSCTLLHHELDVATALAEMNHIGNLPENDECDQEAHDTEAQTNHKNSAGQRGDASFNRDE